MERQPAMASMSRNPSSCYIADEEEENHHHHYCRRRPSEWFNSSLHRPRSFLDSLFRRDTRKYENRERHFLDLCYLCKNTLRNDKDIFMYRGDTPFCSEVCRQEQIEFDEDRERNASLSRSLRVAMSNSNNTNGSSGRSTSPSESPDHPRLCSDTVAVA